MLARTTFGTVFREVTTSGGAILVVVVALAISSAWARGKLPSRVQASSTPSVGREFQPEISQLARGGLKLKEALEASLEPPVRHLAAIFERAGTDDASQRFEFRIIESTGGAPKTIFRRSDFYFTLGTGAPDKLNATDINGDGHGEIIVQSSSGGNCWSCNPTEIYRVVSHKAELIAAGPIQRVGDLNNDGIAELLMTDARWESYADLSHAAAPVAVMVYTWKNGKYVYASGDFGAYYKGEIERLRVSIAEATADITTDEYSDEIYVGLAIGLAITYFHAGEPERGLTELQTILKTNSKSVVQTRRRATILQDFRNGESAKRLREMKYGDPLPLG